MATSSGRNFYITTATEGNDAVGTTGRNYSGQAIIGIGNAFVSDYTLDVAVGSLPTVSVTLEGSNMVVGNTHSGLKCISGVSMAGVNPVNGASLGGTVDLPHPAEDPGGTISAIRPGDVTFDLSSMSDSFSLAKVDGGNESIHVQSASISLPLSRTPLQRLGSKFAFARVVDFPIVATMTVNGIMNEAQTGALHEIIDRDDTKTVTLTMADSNNLPQMKYTMKGARIESQSFSSSIGSDKTVDMTFTTQIGGPQDTTNGIFVSGGTQKAPFLEGAVAGGFAVGTRFLGGTASTLASEGEGHD